MAFTTRAPLPAQAATNSPPQVSVPITRPLISGFSGLVQSHKSLPERSPGLCSAASVTVQGVANTTASAAATASCGSAGRAPTARAPAFNFPRLREKARHIVPAGGMASGEPIADIAGAEGH